MKRASVIFLGLMVVAVPGVMGEDKKPSENPEATKLLADARAARANWDNFPGFQANVEVNIEGKVHKGPLTVSSDGKVTLKIDDPEAAKWAERQLSSLVGHRLDNSNDANTPCAFADDNTHHPLGRAIQVLNDEFHSSYRIRDRQVIVVNRTQKESRFTITVLENRLNENKQYLPVSYVVSYWDVKGETLKRSDTHHHTWKRVHTFDLPLELLVVSATPTKQEARSLKLSGHRLPAGPSSGK
jgi:hypothetical protein